MLYVGGVLALLAVVALVLLVRFVANGGTPRTLPWTLMLLAAVLAGMLLLNVATVFYTPPLWLATLTAGSFIAALVLLFLVGRSVGWKRWPMLALAGVLVLGLVLSTLVLIALPSGEYLSPLFETRAQQIAESRGFAVLLAQGEELVTDYLPVSTAGPDGLSVDYRRFVIQERKADGELSKDDLERIVKAGADERRVPNDAEYEWFEVDGKPALGVEYRAAGPLPKDQSLFRMLVFEKDGVEVRLASEGRNEYKGVRDGEEVYEYAPPLTFEELLRIAEALETPAR